MAKLEKENLVEEESKGKSKYRLTKDEYITFGVMFLISSIIFTLIFFLVEPFGLVSAASGTFTAGFVSLAVLVLKILTNEGAFDTFGYAFASFFWKFTPPDHDRKYKDLYEYKQKKIEKRKTTPLFFVPYVVVGFIYIIVACIIECVLYSSLG